MREADEKPQSHPEAAVSGTLSHWMSRGQTLELAWTLYEELEGEKLKVGSLLCFLPFHCLLSQFAHPYIESKATFRRPLNKLNDKNALHSYRVLLYVSFIPLHHTISAFLRFFNQTDHSSYFQVWHSSLRASKPFLALSQDS
jgi:hypothetical protein